MSKFSKSDKVELITNFFADQGKRLTNLKTATVPRLDELILKHNINLKEQMDKREAQIAKEKEEHKEKTRQHEAKKKAEEEARLKMWGSITEAQQMIICEKIAQHEDELNQKDCENHIALTDRLERDATNAGKRVVREAPTIIRINGVCIHNGYGEQPKNTKEKWFGKMPRAIDNMGMTFATSILADIEQMIAEKNELALMYLKSKAALLETKCGCVIKRDSKEHDECRCDDNGENWICAGCYSGEYDDEVFEMMPICAAEDINVAVKPVVVKKVVKRKVVKKARPTFHLAEMDTFNADYTLFKHERGGFCKYAVYNNTANHYFTCDFDGDKIFNCWNCGETIYKTLNAWTTANWAEQRLKDGNNKTTRNNAYRETKYIPLQLIDIEEIEYGPLHEKIEWLSSMSIENK